METLPEIEVKFFSQEQNAEGADRLTVAPQELIDSEFTVIAETFEADGMAQEKFADLIDELDEAVSPELKETLGRELGTKSKLLDLLTPIKNKR